MNPGTAEQLEAAKEDARLIPFATLFSVNSDGDWKHLAGQTVTRRRNGGTCEKEAVSMILTDSSTHKTIAASATDLAAFGKPGQPNLDFEP
ncbi:hypothetical protein [Aquitalea magnusonii]|uniref:Uncharacterized protein n=1 Tax=Aquitalea magnusonii TaxID=332411 RepID=A0A318JH93_9NEIS|nr:hypothetical protein [Aquitalea magnusonii]PXX49021.1 hypothetical protein DFR38_10557 [Aquitalea magnusonii]